MKKIIFSSLLLVLTFIFIETNGQNTSNKFTLKKIFKENIFSPVYPPPVKSMKDGDNYSIIKDSSLKVFKYRNKKYIETIVTEEEINKNHNGTYIRLKNYQFSNDENKILIATKTEKIYRRSYKFVYYVWDIIQKTLIPLTDTITKVRLAEFSPDGNAVSYVYENNLYVKDLKSGEKKQITNDGKVNFIINGTTDWVYEEEFAITKGFYWSNDGSKIAYYKFDESHVKEYTLVYYHNIYPDIYKYKYPKAGEHNSIVNIYIYDIEKNRSQKVDLGREKDIYIPRIKWTQTPEKLAIQRLNRLQNKLEILLADAVTGQTEVIYTETNPYYIEITDSWTFLSDEEHFIITSEKEGYNHIFLYGMNGSLIRQLTKGRWDVTELIGYCSNEELVYYQSAEISPINRDIYAVKLNGYKTKLSQREGYNDAEFSSNYKYYVNTWSDANTPPVVTVNKSNGKEIRMLENNNKLKKLLSQFEYQNKEFFTFQTKDGIKLNGWKIMPQNFDPQKTYPVFMYVYGGPGSQTVLNSWNRRNPWYELLAQKGIMIVSVDNRGTGARGQEFKKVTYQQLGKFETTDQIEAAKYLSSLNYVNQNKIAIFGWSYGGYITTLAMTKGSDVFDVGIAVAPVTNWKYYDNIYTERYMRKPQDNPDGYEDNSPINFVDELKGELLLIHGSADDNVHPQNSFEFIETLVEADKQFDLMMYTNKNHGIYGGNTTFHLYKKITGFLIDNFKNNN